MIDKIETYVTIVGVFLVAVFTYLFYQRGQKIEDLQHQVIKNKLEKQAAIVKEKENEAVHTYRDALHKYQRLSNAYKRITKEDSPIQLK